MSPHHEAWAPVATYLRQGHPYGCRVRHVRTGFILDVLSLNFVPQAMIYVDTPLEDHAGKAHVLEHVILGKGRRAQYVRTLEEMSLATATAFTERKRTVFAVQTKASSVFYQLVEEKLRALLFPDFSDFEIQQEVMHMAFNENGTAEEKGTVYVEQCGAFQAASQRAYHHLFQLIYGTGHPLSWEQGGTPEAIRGVRPEHIRAFHEQRYRLHGMGAVVALCDPLGAVLEKMSAMLSLLVAEAETPRPTAALPPSGTPRCGEPPLVEAGMPLPKPASDGTVVHCTFPHTNATHPGFIAFSWPLVLPVEVASEEDGWLQYSLLLILVELLANGATSSLHTNLVAKSDTLTAVGGSVTDEKGFTLNITFEGDTTRALPGGGLEEIRDAVLSELQQIAGWEDGGEALRSFNERAHSHIQCNLKRALEFLQHPPEFGERGRYGEWLSYLDKAVEFMPPPPGGQATTPDIELTYDREADAVEALIASGKNFWRDRLRAWGLCAGEGGSSAQQRIPVTVVASPSPGLLEEEKAEADARCAAFTQGLAEAGKTPEEFKEEASGMMAQTEQANVLQDLPAFTPNPPLTNDPELDFTFDGGILACRVDSLGGCGYLGVAFDLTQVPPGLAVHIPILKSLNSFGVWRDGERVSYSSYCKRAQEEVLHIDTYLSATAATGRAEMVVRGGGLTPTEVGHALGWLRSILTRPDWDPENLPRVREVVAENLRGVRKTLHSRAEYWGSALASAFHHQGERHYMMAECCLVQEHAFQRMKHMLAVPDDGVVEEVRRIASLESVADIEAALSSTAQHAWVQDLRHMLHCMPGVDDGASAAPREWQIHCLQAADDLSRDPSATLSDWKEMLRIVVGSSRRGHLVTSEACLSGAREGLESLMHSFPPGGRGHAEAELPEAGPGRGAGGQPIKAKWEARHPGQAVPVFSSLFVGSLPQGVAVHSMPIPPMLGDGLSREEMLELLAAKARCGGGAHTPFIGVWNNGLAYSSGVGCSEINRVLYYADHCPNVARTLEYARSHVAQEKHVKGLLDYALCQCFTSRSGQTYHQRCEAMSFDLANGVTPEKVSAFRSHLLSMRGLFDDSALVTCTSALLQLFDVEAAAHPSHLRFVVGNGEQCQLYENYAQVPVARYYISDFWLE